MTHKLVRTCVRNGTDMLSLSFQIQAPGTDERFTVANDPITITLNRSMETTAFLAYLFFNGTYNNESQYSITTNISLYMTDITYEQPGLHQAFSMVWNKVSLELTELTLVVVRTFEIENLTITMDSHFTKTLVPRMKFYMRASKGYVSSCSITYGNLETSTYEKTLSDFYDTIENDPDIGTAITSDPGIEHDFTKLTVYSEPGLYHVRVFCENEINSVDYSTTITVQNEILDFNVFSLPAHEFGQPIKVVWQVAEGTSVTVDVWYNDILCNTTNIIITGNQNNSCECLVTNSTHFDPDTLVDIKLTARNLVSNITKIVTVEIFEKMVITSLVAVTSTSQWGSGVPGAGPNQNKFPVENSVIFKANYTGGPATSHAWVVHFSSWIKYCVNCGSRTGNSVQDYFNFDLKEDICDVKLVLSNSAAETEEMVTIDIDRSFNLTRVSMISPIIMNKTETLTIALGDIGTHTCIAVDFGDSSPLLLYGEYQACDEEFNHSSRSDMVFSPRDLSTTSIQIDYVFETAGTYQVKIDGRNYISWDSFEQQVVVVSLPCEYPNVTITGNVHIDANGLHFLQYIIHLSRYYPALTQLFIIFGRSFSL